MLHKVRKPILGKDAILQKGHARHANLGKHDNVLVDGIQDFVDNFFGIVHLHKNDSAECYLLFALGRADVFPAADLALAVSYQNWRRLAERPGEPDFRVIAEAWAPHRSAAARLLWHAYRREVV